MSVITHHFCGLGLDVPGVALSTVETTSRFSLAMTSAFDVLAFKFKEG
jgi:hypothetical protein